MTNYTNTANFNKNPKNRSQCILFITLLFIIFPTYSDESIDIAKQNPISVSYTITSTDGEEVICEISSTDSIEELRKLKNSSCQLSFNDVTEHPLVKLKQKNRNNEKKEILITTRNFLMWAYLAVHVYKAWDSGIKIFWPEKKGHCCKSKTAVTKTQRAFFGYYITGLVRHGWSYLSSYIMTAQEMQPDQNDSDHSPSPDEEQEQEQNESWTDTIKGFTSKLSEYSYSWHILSLALDSAALKWDCDCPGYLFYPDNFKDPSKSGHFYFNGHLWMLLLNVAIFATDLAIDYL